MLRLRPYKNTDAQKVLSWLTDERAFFRWCADSFEHYPITTEEFNEGNKELEKNDGFSMTAYDEEGVAGYLRMKFLDTDKKDLRFSCIVVSGTRRGRGYGKEMLQIALKYAFEILLAERVSLRVFTDNEPALHCYNSIGFVDSCKEEKLNIMGEVWTLKELEKWN